MREVTNLTIIVTTLAFKGICLMFVTETTFTEVIGGDKFPFLEIWQFAELFAIPGLVIPSLHRSDAVVSAPCTCEEISTLVY